MPLEFFTVFFGGECRGRRWTEAEKREEKVECVLVGLVFVARGDVHQKNLSTNHVSDGLLGFVRMCQGFSAHSWPAHKSDSVPQECLGWLSGPLCRQGLKVSRTVIPNSLDMQQLLWSPIEVPQQWWEMQRWGTFASLNKVWAPGCPCQSEALVLFCRYGASCIKEEGSGEITPLASQSWAETPPVSESHDHCAMLCCIQSLHPFSLLHPLPVWASSAPPASVSPASHPQISS